MYRDSLKRTAGSAMRLLSAIGGGGGTHGCSLDDVLSVDLPGKVVGRIWNRSKAGGTPGEQRHLGLPSVAGACITAAAAHHSDEIMNASGNNWWRDMGWRQHRDARRPG